MRSMQVESIVNEAASSGQQYAFIPWAVAAAVAGGAEAVVTSVLNGEAAACKCNFVSGMMFVEGLHGLLPGG